MTPLSIAAVVSAALIALTPLFSRLVPAGKPRLMTCVLSMVAAMLWGLAGMGVEAWNLMQSSLWWWVAFGGVVLLHQVTYVAVVMSAESRGAV